MKNNMAKNNFKFTYVNEINRHNTRNCKDFYIQPAATQYGAKNFYIRSLSWYNAMPQEIKRLKALTTFKNKLREFLLGLSEGENRRQSTVVEKN